jgi:hypothetical protein
MYRDRCALVCRLVAVVPILKSIVLVLATAFWFTCDTWGMCSFWLGVAVVNTHLVYEASVISSFYVIAHGNKHYYESIVCSVKRLNVHLIQVGPYLERV